MRTNSFGVIALCGMLWVAWSAAGSAAPVVSGVFGTIAHEQQVRVTGSSFGQKSPAKPFLWAPFEGGADPSSLGIVTSWNIVESMGYAPGEGFNGSGALKATDGSGVWTAGVVSQDFAWNDYNQQMYLYRRIKRNFDVTSTLNWKILRVWGANWGSPNWWIQSGNGNLSVELGGPGTPGSGGYPYGEQIISPIQGGDLQAVRGRANVWRTEEILTRSNSAAGVRDGQFYHRVHGRLVGVMPYSSYQRFEFSLKNSDSTNDMVLIFPVHGVKANTTLPPEYRYWADDVYLDSTWARVMIGNARRLADCTHLEVQIPFEWSAGQIGVMLNIRSFPADSTPYLFVVDAEGNASDGYPLGVTLPQPQPPQNLIVE